MTVGVALAAAVAVAASAALAEAPGPLADLVLRQTGPIETVFAWRTDRCEESDLPDAPARAFRDHLGQVRLIASHHVTRQAVGPDLDSARHRCDVGFASRHADDPAQFDDRTWLMSFHTADGLTVHALGHTEFQGHRRPALCPARRYVECWYNSITAAVSTDGGDSFARPASSFLVAAPVERFEAGTGRPRGYFSPTGIHEVDGYFYVLVHAMRSAGQRYGMCLLRTDRLDDPGRWRAWDGQGFGIALRSPYEGAGGEGCTPVGAGVLNQPVTSLVRHEASGLFVALMVWPAAARAAERDGPHWFIATAVSRDLIGWRRTATAIPFNSRNRPDCDGPEPILSYPSLLDPDSPSPNFETVGAGAYIYATRSNALGEQGCRFGNDRDLVRFPVAIEWGGPESGSLESGSLESGGLE